MIILFTILFFFTIQYSKVILEFNSNIFLPENFGIHSIESDSIQKYLYDKYIIFINPPKLMNNRPKKTYSFIVNYSNEISTINPLVPLCVFP